MTLWTGASTINSKTATKLLGRPFHGHLEKQGDNPGYPGIIYYAYMNAIAILVGAIDVLNWGT